MELVVDERVKDGEWRWQMIQPILLEAVPCLMFIKFFSHFYRTSGYLQSDPHSHYLCVLSLMWNISLQIFI